jgi:hypothetical protein
MLRIYADFNTCDEEGRVCLNTVGSLRDIEAHRDELREGARVLLYVPGDFEVEGTLEFNRIWLAVPDLSTLRYDESSS